MTLAEEEADCERGVIVAQDVSTAARRARATVRTAAARERLRNTVIT
jgi:hypothetical protein